MRSLLNSQQYYDPEGIAEKLGISPATWPLAGLLWDAGLQLAEFMMNFDIKEKRILEVGCGLGLTSIFLHDRGADITATDVHPDAESNLLFNTRLNNLQPIPFVRTDWKDTNHTLGKFDLLIASDVLYQPNHPGLIAAFINRHTFDPSQLIIVDPARGNFSRFNKEMKQYGFNCSEKKLGDAQLRRNKFKGQIRSFSN